MIKKALVTGGAGFIGSHLVDILLKSNYEVFVYDDFSYGKKEYLSKDPALHYVEGNILDKDTLQDYVVKSEPSIVYHLAALHHIPTCENKPTEALKINIEGTQNVLDCCKSIASLDKLVFASSGAVYEIVDDGLSEEKTATVPYDIYSVSKLCGEQLVRLWANKYNKKAGVARIFNTIGGRETNAHLVPEIIEQILAGVTEIKLGNLEPKRSYIDTRDTAMGIMAIGEYSSDKSFDIFNVGREDEYSVKEIVDILSEVTGAKLNIVQDANKVRKVDRKRQKALINKINEHTGWKPQYTVKEGLQYAFEFAKRGSSR